jgi:hypothetical protein
MNHNPTAPAVSKRQEKRNRSVGALVLTTKPSVMAGHDFN